MQTSEFQEDSQSKPAADPAYLAAERRKRELREKCFKAAAWLRPLDHGDAAEFIDYVVDWVIDLLRDTDKRPLLDLELVFADLRAETTRELSDLINDHVPLDDAVSEIVDALSVTEPPDEDQH